MYKRGKLNSAFDEMWSILFTISFGSTFLPTPWCKIFNYLLFRNYLRTLKIVITFWLKVVSIFQKTKKIIIRRRNNNCLKDFNILTQRLRIILIIRTNFYKIGKPSWNLRIVLTYAILIYRFKQSFLKRLLNYRVIEKS